MKMSICCQGLLCLLKKMMQISIKNCLWPSWRSMINHIKNNRWIFLGGGQLHKTSWVLDPRTAPWAKRVQAYQGATLSQWTSQRTECNGTKKSASESVLKLKNARKKKHTIKNNPHSCHLYMSAECAASRSSCPAPEKVAAAVVGWWWGWRRRRWW